MEMIVFWDEVGGGGGAVGGYLPVTHPSGCPAGLPCVGRCACLWPTAPLSTMEGDLDAFHPTYSHAAAQRG